ncbi:hypothetical protein Gotri_011317, partial [Gossypium trilobum]|nr:hypothetical protein [Gossypium trilobum]
MSESFDQSFSCYADSNNFTTNTTYAKNLDFILHSLPNNVSEHGGFFSVTVGQGSNKAYTLGLCRGDLTSYVCHSCVKFAVDDLRASLMESVVTKASNGSSTLKYATGKDKEDTQEVQLLDLVPGSVPHKNLSGDFNLENGTLTNGKEIAVKRLSITFDQGLLKFKNE